MKFRIEEAKGAIAGMQMEKEKLGFERVKFEFEAESDTEDGNKEHVLRQLDLRLREANESYRNLGQMIKDGPPQALSEASFKRIDSSQQREDRIDELRGLLRDKQELETGVKQDIRSLTSKLQGERNKHHEGAGDLVGDYNGKLTDLNVAYDDVITSTREHLQMNTTIMRKEKEIKELEARIAFLSSGSSEDEYRRLNRIYENEKRSLNELYRRQREKETNTVDLQHKKDYADKLL